jgi:hypothetical protein
MNVEDGACCRNGAAILRARAAFSSGCLENGWVIEFRRSRPTLLYRYILVKVIYGFRGLR